MLDFYEESGINPIQYRIQCYDGGPEKKGVASFILKESENVVVTYCCLYNLNLSNFGISKNSTYWQCDWMVQKHYLLLQIVSKEIRRLGNIRRQILIEMCKTRWLERYLTYEYFYPALPFIVKNLEIINVTQAKMGSFKKK